MPYDGFGINNDVLKRIILSPARFEFAGPLRMVVARTPHHRAATDITPATCACYRGSFVHQT